MDKKIFICYARKDLDIIKGFLYDLNEEAVNYPFKIKALIDKSKKVLRAGDRSKEKLQQHIKNSDGAVVFISSNFAESQFIKEYEIPEILAKKKSEPDYIITPIFIDKDVEVSTEILSFQSPNTEEEGIRKLTPGLRELIYKKNIKEIYEYFTELMNVEDIQSKRIDKRNVTSKWFNKKSLKNIAIILMLGGLVNTFSVSSFSDSPIDQPELEKPTLTSAPDIPAEVVDENSNINEILTYCIQNTFALYDQQWNPENYEDSTNPENYIRALDSYDNAISVDCSIDHDGEFYHSINTQYKVEEISKLIDQPNLNGYYAECFDNFKELTGYSPFESSFVIDLLIFQNEEKLNVQCVAIYLKDDNGEWSDLTWSILWIDKEDLYEEYSYRVITLEELTVGDCAIHPFSLVSGAVSFYDETMSNLVTVSCNKPHSYEVFHKFKYIPESEISLKKHEDELAKRCSENPDGLYGDSKYYEQRVFKYLTDIEKLKNKQEVNVFCLVYTFNDLFYIPVKKNDSIASELSKKSYQLLNQKEDDIPSVKITNCPDVPMPAYLEDQFGYTNDYYRFSWKNLNNSETGFVKITFSDAVGELVYNLDLNTFESIDINLNTWTTAIIIEWEYYPEQTNNYGIIKIEYIEDNEVTLTDTCEIDLYLVEGVENS